MNRLLLEKTGNAVWISHLDFMRVLQRSFRRAGFLLKHTGGFNQHAYVSLALPLSVGTASRCEILDYTLEQEIEPEELCRRLNDALPEGVRVLCAYESTEKLKYLTHLRAEIALEYDNGVPSTAREELQTLFARPELVVEKKGKSGLTQVDIAPMLSSLDIAPKGSLVQRAAERPAGVELSAGGTQDPAGDRTRRRDLSAKLTEGLSFTANVSLDGTTFQACHCYENPSEGSIAKPSPLGKVSAKPTDEVNPAAAEASLTLTAVVCAQNPSLNPALLVTAIETYLPHLKPDFSRITRLEVLRADGTPFR